MKMIRWILVVVLIFSLILVRAYEDVLFYDPLLQYFHSDFVNTDFPNLDVWRHFGSVICRYILNAVISLGIIYFMFKDVRITKFSGFILFILLIPFLVLYYYFIQTEFEGMFTAGFYVRRFLLQPVLLLVLIPAIWFYKNQLHTTAS